jgi:hypothetical protein
VHAVIVLRDGVLATEREILNWCIDRIAGYKRSAIGIVPERGGNAEDRHGKNPAPRPARSDLCAGGHPRSQFGWYAGAAPRPAAALPARSRPLFRP